MSVAMALTSLGVVRDAKPLRDAKALRDAKPARRAAPLLPDLGRELPGVIADRLAGIMAQDPGLAAAVSAHLPAARESARALAAYLPPAPMGVLDLKV